MRLQENRVRKTHEVTGEQSEAHEVTGEQSEGGT